MEGYLLEVIALVILSILARLFFLVHKITTGNSRINSKRRLPVKTLICIGSGGHTTEMLALLAQLEFDKYTPRFYVLALSDSTSLDKITAFEDRNPQGCFYIQRIPRSRKVHQSYTTATFTTLYSILSCIPLIWQTKPDLILCNGPGTCIPICLAAFFMKAAYIRDTKIVFVESYCRTKSLSLSGQILMYFADNFVVQWPGLKKKLKRSEYIGQLM